MAKMQNKPQMLVCYLCGQQFGSASLAIHQPQCYTKQLTWWQNNDPATRGPKPKDPAVHGRKSQDPMSQADVQKHNDENFEDFNQNLSRCEGCGRTFLPDRLVVHQRSCKGASPAGRASPSPAKERSSSRSGSEGRQQGQRPTMLVCYLCGQQFGSASLTIHQPQCYKKQLKWWQNNDPATRGPKPKDPATHGPTQQDIASKGSDAFNSEQFQDYKGNLAPCPNCARTFLPDSLKVHMRSCTGSQARGASTGSTPSDPSAPTGARPVSKAGRETGQRPSMLVCYLCGQQFGSSSLGIHQPQCYKKKCIEWERADPAGRGPKPRDPASVDQAEMLKGGADAFNEQQFNHYNTNLAPCTNCGRTFAPDRLVAHMKSCNPAASGRGSKPVTQSHQPRSPPPHSHSPGQQQQHNGPPSTPPPHATGDHSSKRSPLVNRTPGNVVLPSKQCPQCGVCEHDADARFCEECGGQLVSAPEESVASSPEAPLGSVCAQCGKEWDTGKFCQDCGGTLVARPQQPAPPSPGAQALSCGACGSACGSGAQFCEDCGAPVGARAMSAHSGGSGSGSGSGSGNRPSSVVSGGSASHKRSPIRNRVASNASLASGVSGHSAEAAAAKQWLTESQAPRELPVVGEAEDYTRTVRPGGDDGGGGETGVGGSGGSGGSSLYEDDAEELGATVPAGEEQQLVPCGQCGRKFAADRVAKHQSVCAKTSGKQRKQFNSAQHRLEGLDGVPPPSSKRGVSSEPPKAKADWKAKSAALRGALQSAREVSEAMKSGKPLPPPTYTPESEDTRVPCPGCGRKFAQEVADRHIPVCKGPVHKPKGPKGVQTPKKARKAVSGITPTTPGHSSARSTSLHDALLSPGGTAVPPDVARMGISDEKWRSIQAKKEAEMQDAYAEAPQDLRKCPNCNRNFIPASLEVHLRSCGGSHGTSKKLSR
eukprot:Rhum_TRINITY_DN14340_c10_g1::Rhum_TRINITY_DN14340_c10_g1_i1::g.83578::m.83578